MLVSRASAPAVLMGDGEKPHWSSSRLPSSRPSIRPGPNSALWPVRGPGSTRDGEILKVLGDDGAPPYLVRWEDGHESEVFPGSDMFIQHFEGADEG